MQSGQEVVYLHLDDIIPNRFQPREVFDERALKELAASIKEHGVIQPIIVRQVNNKYEIIAGERRYKASALAGMTKIPAIVNNLDDKEAAKVALLENLQRKNLNPIEEARTYQKILELDQMTQESLAKTMGKSQSAVANKLRLLSLPDEIQIALLKEEISERHARALLNIDNSEKQKELLNRVINEKMSVRNLEEEIKNINLPQQQEKEGVEMNNNAINMDTIMPTSQNESKPNLMEAFNINDNNSNIQESQNNVVNYGDIDEDEIINEDINFDDSNSSTDADKEINIDDMKSNTVDIDQIINEQRQEKDREKDTNEQKISNDLDNLLNIQPPKNTGFNPMQELMKENDNEEINKEEYFQGPDLMNIQLPNTNNDISPIINSENNDDKENNQMLTNINDLYNKSFFNNNSGNNKENNINQNRNKTLGMALMEDAYNIPKKEQVTSSGLNINQMIEEIRKTIQLLEKNGAKIDTDEIDFENQYQIVIRIDKNNLKG